jgi:hypothetical protein
MTQKRRQKWVSSYIIVCIYNKKQSLVKKRTLWCPASRRALSNKKNLNILTEPGPRNLGNKIQKITNRQTEKSIFFLGKIVVFEQWITEIIKIFHQRRVIGKQTISFLRDLKTGYLSMHLSQFRKI